MIAVSNQVAVFIACLSQRNCKQFVLMFALFNLDLLKSKTSSMENGHST